MKHIQIKLITLSIIFAISSILTFLIVDYGKNNKEVVIQNLSTNNNIQISKIVIGGHTKKLSDLKNDKLLYNEEYDFLYINSNQEVTLKISSLDDIVITFIKNSDNGTVSIEEKTYNYQKTTKIDCKNNEIDYIDYINGITIKEILKIELNKYKGNFLFYIFIIVEIICSYFEIKTLKYFKDKLIHGNITIKDVLFMACIAFILFLKHIYVFTEVFNYIYFIFIALVLLIVYRNNKVIFAKEENIFLIMALITGMMFIFLHPPFNVPDEYSHFVKSYSNTFNKEEKKNNIENEKTYDAIIFLNDSETEFIYKYIDDIHSNNYQLTVKSMLADFNKKMNVKTGHNGIWYGNTETLGNFCYIPTSITLYISRVLNLPIMLTFTLGRFTNFLVYLILMYIAIKKIPKFKKTFMIIGLLPITLEMAAAYSQDSITNTVFFYLLYLIIDKIYTKNNEKYTIKSFTQIIIFSIFIGLCKLAYFPVVFLLLLIPKEKFKKTNVKKYIVWGIIILTLLISIFGIYQSSKIGTGSGTYYTKIDMIKYPIKTAEIFLRTFLDRGDLDFIRGLVDGFGYFTKWGIYNTLNFILNFITLLLYILANNNEVRDIKVKERITFFIIGGLIMGIIYSSLLTGWTPPDSSVVQGLQSRYFIPVNILFILAITNNIIKVNIKDNNKFFFILLLIIHLISIFNLITGFYI